MLIFKCFNELLQVEPAIGNNAENLDMVMNTPIGIGKEGNDVVP